MQGILVSVDPNLQQALIACDNKLYTAKLSKDEAALSQGDKIDFSVLDAPGFLKNGTAQIETVTKTDYSRYKLAVTAEDSVNGHDVIDIKKNIKLCGEGPDAQSALDALIALGEKSNANALLNTKLTVIPLRFSGKHLFCYTATAAIIEGPKFHQKPGIRLDINEKIARSNSPNRAMLRYIRVLLISLLLILVPCILSLQQQTILPNPVGSVICGIALGLALYTGLFYNSRKVCAYLLNHKR